MQPNGTDSTLSTRSLQDVDGSSSAPRHISSLGSWAGAQRCFGKFLTKQEILDPFFTLRQSSRSIVRSGARHPAIEDRLTQWISNTWHPPCHIYIYICGRFVKKKSTMKWVAIEVKPLIQIYDTYVNTFLWAVYPARFRVSPPFKATPHFQKYIINLLRALYHGLFPDFS